MTSRFTDIYNETKNFSNKLHDLDIPIVLGLIGCIIDDNATYRNMDKEEHARLFEMLHTVGLQVLDEEGNNFTFD